MGTHQPSHHLPRSDLLVSHLGRPHQVQRPCRAVGQAANLLLVLVLIQLESRPRFQQVYRLLHRRDAHLGTRQERHLSGHHAYPVHNQAASQAGNLLENPVENHPVNRPNSLQGFHRRAQPGIPPLFRQVILVRARRDNPHLHLRVPQLGSLR